MWSDSTKVWMQDLLKYPHQSSLWRIFFDILNLWWQRACLDIGGVDETLTCRSTGAEKPLLGSKKKLELMWHHRCFQNCSPWVGLEKCKACPSALELKPFLVFTCEGWWYALIFAFVMSPPSQFFVQQGQAPPYTLAGQIWASTVSLQRCSQEKKPKENKLFVLDHCFSFAVFKNWHYNVGGALTLWSYQLWIIAFLNPSF